MRLALMGPLLLLLMLLCCCFSSHLCLRPPAELLRAPPGRALQGYTRPGKGQCGDVAGIALSAATRDLKRDQMVVSRENCNVVCPKLLTDNAKAINPTHLPTSADSLLRRHTWDSCALVANSGMMANASQGHLIDRHDVVLRFNAAPTVGYEAHVGNKTTFRLLNRKWTSGYGDSKEVLPKYRASAGYHPLERGVTLLLSRSHPMRASATAAFWATKRSDVSVGVLSRPLISISHRVTLEYRKCLIYFHLLHPSKVGTLNVGGLVPTSGILGVLFLKKFCKSVSVYGAGDVRGESAYQYYDNGHGTLRKSGDTTHSFIVEAMLFRDLAARGAIKLCHPDNGC